MTLYPGSLQVPPMRYGNKPSEAQILKSWESGNWVAQEKKDGAWYQLEKTDAGDIYLFGRTVSKKTGEYTEKIANVPHIKSWASCLPNGTILIGEIHVPGGKSNDVTKIMGCTAANAYKRQFESDEYGGPIHYYIFDCIRYNGVDLCSTPFIERYDYYLQKELGELFSNQDYIELAPLYKHNFEERLQEIFTNGGEGMVFKRQDCLYRPDKRTSPLKEAYKYKEHLDSIDLICMELLDPVKEYTGKELDTWPYWIIEHNIHFGYINGNNFAPDYHSDFRWYKNCPIGQPEYIKSPDYRTIPVTKPYYFDWCNAMRLGAYKNGELVEVCRVASGFTDTDRENMGLYPNKYLGKVVEIECMSLTKDNCVRHPVFKRMRDDKEPQDCLYDEIFPNGKILK